MKIRELVGDLSCHFNTLEGKKICEDTKVQALLEREIGEITNDSRKVLPGSLFFCIIGANSDGHDYAAMAIEKGASALVVQKEIDLSAARPEGAEEPAVIRVEDSRLAMAVISAAFYGHPAERMKIIGVTDLHGEIHPRGCGNPDGSCGND